MNLYDILFYYHRAPVIVNTGFIKFKGTIKGIYHDKWYNNNIEEQSIQVITESGATYTYKPVQVKLILRQIRDITIEEAAHCLQQTFFDHVTYPINDYRLTHVGLVEKDNPRIRIDNDHFTCELTFGNKTGSIWSCDTPAANVKIRPTIFTYLLAQGFDLFGLIPAGLAIDKKTLS